MNKRSATLIAASLVGVLSDRWRRILARHHRPDGERRVGADVHRRREADRSHPHEDRGRAPTGRHAGARRRAGRPVHELLELHVELRR